MKKFWNLSFFLDLLTIATFGFLFLDSIFYYGFTHKHFFVDSKNLLIFYFCLSLILFFFKKISISLWLNRLNKLFLPIIIFAACIFHYLEETHYINYVYTYFHINYINFLALPLLSGFVYYFNNKNKFKKHFYFLIPLFSLIISQVISFRLNFQYYLYSNLIAYFINYFLWFFVWLFCTSLFKKRSTSISIYLIIFSLFSLINYLKIKYLNIFFVVNDLLLLKYNIQYLRELIFQIKWTELAGTIILIVFLVNLFICFKKKIIKNNFYFLIRIPLLLFSLFIITFPVFSPINYKKILKYFKIDTYIWGPIENCKNNGILFCFYDDLKNITNPPPADYSQNTIQQIYSNLNLTSEKMPSSQFVKPTIIVILSEAFWDITKLPNTKFSQDPISNIRKDITSTLVSPTIGNATANVEFELITGLSNYFLNGAIPYSQSVRKDMPSLFTAFKEQGYQTTTIHPYFASMYNRPNVYKYLGLDKYISMEKMDNVEFAGPFVSDRTFTKEILKQYYSTPEPQFIFALSMQNHFPFETDRFSSHDIKIDTSLSPDDKNILQTYTDGINLSDIAYQALKNDLSKSNIPTIVILFGDHLPLLNPGFQLFADAGYDSSDQLKMRSTPITIWSNFDSKIDIKPTQMSPCFLGLEILKIANINPKYQFAYLQFISNTDTTLETTIPPKFTSKQLTDYELIQYDLIYGKQYSLK